MNFVIHLYKRHLFSVMKYQPVKKAIYLNLTFCKKKNYFSYFFQLVNKNLFTKLSHMKNTFLPLKKKIRRLFPPSLKILIYISISYT